MDSVLALHPAAPGSILGAPNNFFFCWDLLTTLLRTVDGGLMMSINPIQFDFDDRKKKKQEPETVDDELKLGLNNNVLYDFLL